ncbi:MAG: hypothetical protein C4B58_05855 [Deltaproteobacteria bacterium]|nr:MAG: hypothetical protein C4B58_05855 [Deltaproteobacteria bacterium]
MKKTFIAMCCIAFMFVFSSTVLATTTSTQSSPGEQVSISVTNVSGATSFTFDPSPRVGIRVATSESAYAITAANSLTGTDNGMEYGTYNTATGYALKAKTTAAGTEAANGPTAPTDEDTLGGSGTWNWQGAS